MDSVTAQQIQDMVSWRGSSNGIAASSLKWTPRPEIQSGVYTLTLMGLDGTAHACRFTKEDLEQYRKHPERVENAITAWLSGITR